MFRLCFGYDKRFLLKLVQGFRQSISVSHSHAVIPNESRSRAAVPSSTVMEGGGGGGVGDCKQEKIKHEMKKNLN